MMALGFRGIGRGLSDAFFAGVVVHWEIAGRDRNDDVGRACCGGVVLAAVVLGFRGLGVGCPTLFFAGVVAFTAP